MKRNKVKSFLILVSSVLFLSLDLLAQSAGQVFKGWKVYNGSSAYSITIPPTIEQRKISDLYLHLKNLNNKDGFIVFQQKGLANKDKLALKRYCCIIICHIKGSYGDFLKSTETEILDREWKEILDELVSENIGSEAKLIGHYTYKWTTINAAKCIQIDYRRTGFRFDTSIPVVCRMAIFQNDNEMVIMTLAYREKEANLWKGDFERVFRSFKWIQPND